MKLMIQVIMFLSGECGGVYDRGKIKLFQNGSEKINKKREEKLRDKLPKLTLFFQSKNASMEDEDILDISSAAGPSLAITSSSRQTATSTPTTVFYGK